MVDKYQMIQDIKDKLGETCLFAFTQEFILCPHIIPMLMDNGCPGDLWPEYMLTDEDCNKEKGCPAHWERIFREAGLLPNER